MVCNLTSLVHNLSSGKHKHNIICMSIPENPETKSFEMTKSGNVLILCTNTNSWFLHTFHYSNYNWYDDLAFFDKNIPHLPTCISIDALSQQFCCYHGLKAYFETSNKILKPMLYLQYICHFQQVSELGSNSSLLTHKQNITSLRQAVNRIIHQHGNVCTYFQTG